MPVWDSSGESRLKAFAGKEPPPNYLADLSQVVFDDRGGLDYPVIHWGEAVYIEECLALLCKMSQRAMRRSE